MPPSQTPASLLLAPSLEPFRRRCFPTADTEGKIRNRSCGTEIDTRFLPDPRSGSLVVPCFSTFSRISHGFEIFGRTCTPYLCFVILLDGASCTEVRRTSRLFVTAPKNKHKARNQRETKHKQRQDEESHRLRSQNRAFRFPWMDPPGFFFSSFPFFLFFWAIRRSASSKPSSRDLPLRARLWLSCSEGSSIQPW
jgi:hypothetical protein